ncbi:MAG: 23S rRNA (pseudouridine(1915)-N(3))-methyltransferase RlmH [Bdellovibrionota bacterium]
MKITLITIGHSLTAQEKIWIDIYLKRMRAFAEVQHKTYKDRFDLYQDRNDPKYEKWVTQLVDPKSYFIALDEHGKKFSTTALAKHIQDIELQNKHLTFLLGGSYGLPAAVIEQAHTKLSLSTLTFPHKLAFLMLCEQLYRCFTIHKNIPYHHD